MTFEKPVMGVVAFLAIFGMLEYQLRATLDGIKDIDFSLHSRSGKGIAAVQHDVRSTLHDATICVDYPEEAGWKAAPAIEIKANRFPCSVYISRHVTGILGFETSYGQYSGLVLQLRFIDGSTQSLAVNIPHLRYQPQPYELKINVD